MIMHFEIDSRLINKLNIFLDLPYGERRYCLKRLLVISFTLLLCSFNVAGQNFRAAAVTIDITPDTSNPQWLIGYFPRKSTGVHDPIHLRIALLDDGTTQFVLMSTDVCILSPAEYDKVTAKIKQQLGIDPVDVWWTVAHDHSAPQIGPTGLEALSLPERHKFTLEDTEYTKMVEQKLMDGIIKARKELTPARLGVGWGFAKANMNRRAIDIDGKASLGMNPYGAVDRRIGLIRVDKKDGRPIALIANYAMHGTVAGQSNTMISGDAPGIVADYVEKRIGAPMLYINGAAGDLAPLYSTYPSLGAGHLGQFRVLLGDRIIEAYQKILSTTDSVKLFARRMTIETPRRTGKGWPEDLGKYSRTTKPGINIVKMPISFLKINDNIAIWSAPVELFCEISNYIRMQSPFPYTFYFGYCNGWMGYFPTSEAFKQGGYEVNIGTLLTPSAEKTLTGSVLSYLEGELKSTP